jgi:hypothetical protein
MFGCIFQYVKILTKEVTTLSQKFNKMFTLVIQTSRSDVISDDFLTVSIMNSDQLIVVYSPYLVTKFTLKYNIIREHPSLPTTKMSYSAYFGYPYSGYTI